MAAVPLLGAYRIGDVIDFTEKRKGRVCNWRGDKIKECPHCRRHGMHTTLISGKVRYVHQGILDETSIQHLQITDACTMWPRTEHKLRYGTDSLHPKFRHPGDDDMTVEETRS